MRGRQIVRRYLIRSPYKRLVKTTRYRKPTYTARSLLKAPNLRDATVNEVRNIICMECEVLCKTVPAPSLLRSSSITDLSQFTMESIVEELRNKAPVLWSVLNAAGSSTQSTKPCQSMVVMAIAVLLKSRSEKMCKFQAIISALLYAGHASKKVHSVYNVHVHVHTRVSYRVWGALEFSPPSFNYLPPPEKFK